jgi:predicted Zn-dependent protease
MELSASDKHHLNAAGGWLDLDEPVEANKELEEIGFANRTHLEVLFLRCRVYLATHRAEYAYDIATSLAEQLPELAESWFYLASACARLSQNEAAASALKKCFLAADRNDAQKEWQERALAAKDLEGTKRNRFETRETTPARGRMRS